MIIVLKQDAPDVQVREFCHELEDMGLQINDSKGSESHILGLIGDTKAVAESWVLANPVVEACAACPNLIRKPTASSTRTTASSTWTA